MSKATIEVNGLRKRFGQTVALDGLSFTVAPGTVTGFVGPNGAGKSTTMRLILGLDSVDEGTALIDGRPYASLTHPMRHVGSLLDAGALQPSRSGRNHLLWIAHSQRLPVSRVRSGDPEALAHPQRVTARFASGGLPEADQFRHRIRDRLQRRGVTSARALSGKALVRFSANRAAAGLRVRPDASVMHASNSVKAGSAHRRPSSRDAEAAALEPAETEEKRGCPP
jgi:ABC-type sugar transport system ATPase subunit